MGHELVRHTPRSHDKAFRGRDELVTVLVLWRASLVLWRCREATIHDKLNETIRAYYYITISDEVCIYI